jgi:hypothetical protein
MTDLGGLTPDLTAAIQRDTAGETIVWVGGPDPQSVFRSRRKVWLMGIPFLAFSLLWESIALGIIPNEQARQQSLSDMVFMGSFGAFFVMAGLAMMWTPFSCARAARKVAYVLTDRKMHIVGSRRTHGLSYVALDSIKTVQMVHHGKARSDLKLIVFSHTNSDGEVIETALVLENLADGPGLEALIRARK